MNKNVRERPQGIEDVCAVVGGSSESGRAVFAVVQHKVEILEWRCGGDVALVVEQHHGKFVQRVAEFFQVLLDGFYALQIFLLAFQIRIGNEHNAVGVAQHALAVEVVRDFSRHGENAGANGKSVEQHRVARDEVEGNRRVLAVGDRGNFAYGCGVEIRVKVAERRGFSGERRAAEDDFELNLARAVVGDRHGAGLAQAGDFLRERGEPAVRLPR